MPKPTPRTYETFNNITLQMMDWRINYRDEIGLAMSKRIANLVMELQSISNELYLQAYPLPFQDEPKND